MTTRVAVLASGESRGTNLQSLIDSALVREAGAEIALVVGTRPASGALDRARAAAIPVEVISPRAFGAETDAYGKALLNSFRSYGIGLVCLAGFMVRLPAEVVDAFEGRVLNIHPALLPLFGGQGMYGSRVHEAVLASGVKVSGCTVHFVTHEYDAGPIIAQTPVPVLSDDTVDSLARRVLAVEGPTYSRAVALFAGGMLRIQGSRVVVDSAAELCMGWSVHTGQHGAQTSGPPRD